MLLGSLDNDEDFSWEDEEEEDGKSVTPSASVVNTAATVESETAKHSTPPSQTATPATSSPRESSEDSFDVVSSGSIQGETKASGLDDQRVNDSSDDSDWE